MNLLEILGNIGFDWRVALFNFINFLIVFWLLKRFAFGPIQRVIDERRSKIDKGLEDAKRAETELVMAKESAEAEMDKARGEANSILASARDQEKAIVNQAHEKAREEAVSLRESAESEIEKMSQAAEADIRKRSVEMVVASAEKILRHEIDQKKGEEVIKKMLN